MKSMMKKAVCVMMAAAMLAMTACSKDAAKGVLTKPGATEETEGTLTSEEEMVSYPADADGYAYDTVGDFFADDTINNALKSILEKNSTEQVRVSVRGEGNELTYKYTYLVDDFDPEEAAKNLAGREDEMFESMCPLIEQVTDNVRADAMVYIVFCTADDEEFYRMSFDPEYQKAHASK